MILVWRSGNWSSGWLSALFNVTELVHGNSKKEIHHVFKQSLMILLEDVCFSMDLCIKTNIFLRQVQGIILVGG